MEYRHGCDEIQSYDKKTSYGTASQVRTSTYDSGYVQLLLLLMKMMAIEVMMIAMMTIIVSMEAYRVGDGFLQVCE